MGWLSKLFGFEQSFDEPEPLPERRKHSENGFFWRVEGLPALAAGRGFNQSVVGESFYHENLEALAGGATIHGVMIDQAALLVATEYEGKPAVAVMMAHKRVGSIPASEALTLHRELLALGAERASVKGRIESGFEGGNYCVKLSLSRPLKIRTG
jgi:hypothetical protein